MTAKEIIEKLELIPLPEEGGFYRETFREQAYISKAALPHHSGDRSYSTAIYYLVTPEEFSALHIVASTEIFHFYAGDPVRMIQINKEGALKEVIIGNDLQAGQVPQEVVLPHIWQGTKLIDGGSWALLGCTVAPGFEFEDFKVKSYEELSIEFPHHTELIREFTR